MKDTFPINTVPTIPIISSMPWNHVQYIQGLQLGKVNTKTSILRLCKCKFEKKTIENYIHQSLTASRLRPPTLYVGIRLPRTLPPKCSLGRKLFPLPFGSLWALQTLFTNWFDLSWIINFCWTENWCLPLFWHGSNVTHSLKSILSQDYFDSL